MTLEQALAHLSAQLDELTPRHARSRWVGQAAAPRLVNEIAAGRDVRTVPGPRGLDRGAVRDGGIVATMRKALAEATGSAGGHLVATQVAGEVLALPRARSAVLRLGPTIVPVEKELDLVSLSAGASASYVAENARVPVSEQTFALGVLLRPKELAALVPVSNRLLRDADSNPSVEHIIRTDLVEILSLRADLAFVRGTGTNDEPLGIRNAPV